jgi:asparagine synthase (glutamine-hydrolysing)
MWSVDMNLQYAFSGGYRWTSAGDIYFIGYAFSGNHLCESADDWSNLDMVSELQKASGSFAAVVKKDNVLLLISDVAASFPLFWKQDANGFYISDLSRTKAPSILKEPVLEAMLNLYCTEGTETFFDGWQTVPAGHLLSIDLSTGHTQLHRWFDHFVVAKRAPDDLFERQYLNILQQLSLQMESFTRGRQVVIPLSGGYDSRLILSLLSKLPLSSILCYTYGRMDSIEMKHAIEVAGRMGVRHEVIVYNASVFQSVEHQEWKAYESHCFFGRSLPHEQDFFALLELRRRGLLEAGFVAIPGYCGDIAGGSFLKDHTIQVSSYIQEKHHYHPRYLLADERVADWDIYQQWLTENRLSKFIVNSVRVFEFFGGKWMLPLWNPDLLQLFYSLDFKFRMEQKAYISLAFKHFFNPLNIALVKHAADLPQASRGPKEVLKMILPDLIVKYIRRKTQISAQADPCNLHVLYQMIYQKMKVSGAYQMPEIDYNINFLRSYYHFKQIRPDYGKEIGNLE